MLNLSCNCFVRLGELTVSCMEFLSLVQLVLTRLQKKRMEYLISWKHVKSVLIHLYFSSIRRIHYGVA
jgi:hypothetical protein